MLTLASYVSTLALFGWTTLPTPAAPVTTAAVVDPAPISLLPETEDERNERMRWWRESRFGMFIHWGLYAIPAGEWNGKNVPGAGEWIINSAQIKSADYQPLIKQFNPVKFDAKRWVEIAKNAGMRYIVITSKHHEGFGLWDSALTDWDIASTPFKRDVLKELADACQAEGIRLCFYHSIMDWTHPDYLPRRSWDPRPEVKANFGRYREFMKGQLKELLSGTYGDIGVLWFDGEWESTWTHEFGVELDDYVRSLKRDIIINNRVDVGRDGMVGFSKEPKFRGDFGTPEQQIPATGAPGMDWETCMTMNDTWGFHKNDHNWKSNETLIRMVSDIASKGGNFLLNVGPTAEGEIPPESVERLAAIGAWMKTNGEAIYATEASPFASLSWGRATAKRVAGGTRIFLHVWEWPKDGKLVVPGLLNTVKSAQVLGASQPATFESHGGNVVINVPPSAPDAIATVVALEIEGSPNIIGPVRLKPAREVFVNAVQLGAEPMPQGIVVRFTTDGSEPTRESKELTAVALRNTTTVRAQAFLGDEPVGETVTRTYERLTPWSNFPERQAENTMPRRAIVEGEFNSVAELRSRLPEAAEWPIDRKIAFETPKAPKDNFGIGFRGLLRVPYEGLWSFRLGSDDGSMLLINGKIVIDNDGLHSYRELEGYAPLTRGLHLIEVFMFERTGQEGLKLQWSGSNGQWAPVLPGDLLQMPESKR